jgi:hypothetical protein
VDIAGLGINVPDAQQVVLDLVRDIYVQDDNGVPYPWRPEKLGQRWLMEAVEEKFSKYLIAAGDNAVKLKNALRNDARRCARPQ